MKEYFQCVLFLTVLSFTIWNAISIHELGEQAFRFYADGVDNAVILVLVMYLIDRRL